MPRKILLYAGLAVLMAGAAALLLRNRQPPKAKQPLAGLEPAQLSRIEIRQDGQELRLERSGGTWRLEAPVKDEAEPSEVEALAKALIELSLGSEVSRDPAYASDYGLDEAQAVRVKVFGAASAAPLLDGSFGKEGVGDSLYFRTSREPGVRLAQGVPGYILRRPARDLRRRGLLAFSLGRLDSVSFERPRAFSIERSSADWKASGRRLSAEQAAGIVLALSSLRFSDFPPAPPADRAAGFDRPALKATARAGASSQSILLGREDAGRRWAEVEDRPAVGFVSKPEADALLKLVK